jgi:hypothetical protein
MLNQIVPTATEANFSGVFLKNYLSYIEDFPGMMFAEKRDFLNILLTFSLQTTS